MSELIQHSNSIEWRFERQILRIEPWEKTACASGRPAPRNLAMQSMRYCLPYPATLILRLKRKA